MAASWENGSASERGAWCYDLPSTVEDEGKWRTMASCALFRLVFSKNAAIHSRYCCTRNVGLEEPHWASIVFVKSEFWLSIPLTSVQNWFTHCTIWAEGKKEISQQRWPHKDWGITMSQCTTSTTSRHFYKAPVLVGDVHLPRVKVIHECGQEAFEIKAVESWKVAVHKVPVVRNNCCHVVLLRPHIQVAGWLPSAMHRELDLVVVLVASIF